MCKEIKEKFAELYSLDVGDYIEKKQGLSYLTWSYAWAEFKKIYPDATYEVKKDEQGRCYFGDENIGYMVYTTVTAGGLTYEMWLPVMDNANKSMKLNAYTYQTRNGEKSVDAISMFDINKAVMRCLVKNLAMFGLGLYIYAGEDLPIDVDTTDVDVKDLLNKARSWHEKLEVLAGYYVTDIPDENIKMIKDVCDGNSEEECEQMYHRTVAYLQKKGFSL